MPLSGRLFDTVWRYANLGAGAEDDAEQRVRKAVITMTAMIISFLAMFWGAAYLSLGYAVAGTIPLVYSAITLVSLLLYFRCKRFTPFRLSQLFLILLLPFALQWSLGGFSNGSIVMIWAFFTPLSVLLSDGPRSGRRWLLAFIVLSLLTGLLDPYLAARAAPMPEAPRTVFFLLNTTAGLLSVFGVLNYFVKDSRRYQQQLRANEKRITELMMTDPLTGIANRRRLDEWLARQLEKRPWPLAVIVVDLDRFKGINDTYGHRVGDAVLKRFSEGARTCIRDRDMFARVGGEEFLVVLPNTPADEAYTIAERIRRRVEQTTFDGVNQTVTASFGVCATCEADLSDLIARADRELYRAKAGGRNRVSMELLEPDIAAG